MSVGGTNRTVYSQETMKGSSVSTIMSCLTNANTEAKRADPKGKKKAKNNK